jgi:pimeloyl-ACP methyl ester carboxylesterase
MSVSLHVVDEGAGPPVVLLHGFPDSSALWRHQIPMLVEAGYRAIAPDLRGFGASDRPADVAAYRLEASVADVLALLDQRGIEQADVVGHDWGAALGWALAGLAPGRVRRGANDGLPRPRDRPVAPPPDRRRRTLDPARHARRAGQTDHRPPAERPGMIAERGSQRGPYRDRGT